MDLSAYGVYTTNNTTNTSSTRTTGSDLSIDDFFELLAAQLQNQNMMDPADNTEYIGQMAQFATLTQVSELNSMATNMFAVSLIGKTVTATYTDSTTGATTTKEGVVEDVFFSDGEAYVNIDGKAYDISTIEKISNS